MPFEIVRATVFKVNPELPEPIGIIEYTDSRLDMKIRSAVFDGFISNGAAYLTIRPIAQLLGNQWMSIDLDDCAFPVNTDDLIGIEMVEL